jgi:exodeoxyribonuclease VII small subunit
MAEIDYRKTKKELDNILAAFESDDITIEVAIENYQKAQVLIEKLEQYLKNTKLKITKITKS